MPLALAFFMSSLVVAQAVESPPGSPHQVEVSLPPSRASTDASSEGRVLSAAPEAGSADVRHQQPDSKRDGISAESDWIERSGLVINILNLLATAGIGLVAYRFTRTQARLAKQQLTHELYDEWNTREMRMARSSAWHTLRTAPPDAPSSPETANPLMDWLSGKSWLLDETSMETAMPEEQRNSVITVLEHLAKLHIYYSTSIVDRELANDLYVESWAWWAPVLKPLPERVKARLNNVPENEWLEKSYLYTVRRAAKLDEVLAVSKTDKKSRAIVPN